ncbi:MAG: hypothetical protein M3320_04160 [Actinomycetota bacterium]|nr:hypothetical protein [Actinomycetota bacterium]MDQ5807847.1 hypothetical protein [Actinomycetota bacterium]
MPDRAIIPLLPAASLGFICGIIVATLQLEDGPTLMVGIVGAIVVLLAGASSVFGVRADSGEKAIVAALRAGCAVGIFACIYLFILGFLRDGSIAAIIWLPLAIALGVLMARIAVRDSREEQEVREASS